MTPEILEKFVDENPEAELTGFFWCGGTARVPVYRVCILARAKYISHAAEFRGDSPTELMAHAERFGFLLGEEQTVRECCETAPRSPKLRRKKSQ